MSILIKDMEMPQSCGDCKFFAWKRGVGQHCAVDDGITFHATIDGMDVAYERNGNCPLVPVPPHGRLIDADALLRDNRSAFVDRDGYPEFSYSAVTDAPTIIPAEEVNE